MKTLALSLLIAIALSNPSQAQHRPLTADNSPDKKESSGTRGCPVALPSLQLKLIPLAQKTPVINLSASESGYLLKMSIYPVDGNNEVVWTSEQTTTQGWQKINPRLTLESGRKYAFAAVVPCEGDIGSGEVLRTVFKVD